MICSCNNVRNELGFAFSKFGEPGVQGLNLCTHALALSGAHLQTLPRTHGHDYALSDTPTHTYTHPHGFTQRAHTVIHIHTLFVPPDLQTYAHLRDRDMQRMRIQWFY